MNEYASTGITPKKCFPKLERIAKSNPKTAQNNGVPHRKTGNPCYPVGRTSVVYTGMRCARAGAILPNNTGPISHIRRWQDSVSEAGALIPAALRSPAPGRQHF